MSVRLMAEVFELNEPPSEKLVLLAMADHARDDGTGCYPSIDTLARKTSQSRRGVQKILRRLEQNGLIVPTKVSHGRQTTEYRITLTNREQGSLFAQKQPRTPVRPTANLVPPTANLSASNREPGSPEPLRTIIEPSGNQTPAASPPGDPRHQPFIEYAIQTFKARFGQPPTWNGKNHRALADLLKHNPHLSADELRHRWTAYLNSTEDFILRNGFNLSTFVVRFDGLRDGPILDERRRGNAQEKLTGIDLLKHNVAAAGFKRA